MLDLTKLHQAVRYEGGVSRRLFLAYAGALSSLPLLGRASWAVENPTFPSDPFTLGVASGDPEPDGFVIWTRLAPAPLEVGGGMGTEPVAVSWEVASDEGMNEIVASGRAIATPQLGYSVHVELEGLAPDRWYWYRFRAGEAESPLGRTRTMPTAEAQPEQLKFAFASCQHIEVGYYTAYEQMAKDEPDLVCFLGDYIYENAGYDGWPRKHVGGWCSSLEDYRIRIAQYRADPLLANMHAQCPWLVTWDDHEVCNNYANDHHEDDRVNPADMLARRANAYQAYYEMMPLRARSLPQGPDMQLYRRATFGRLAEFQVLDTRQYRSNQPNGDRATPFTDDPATDPAFDPQQTMLGRQQRGWLEGGLIASQSTWNVLAQQVVMAMLSMGETAEGTPTYHMDSWTGYNRERMDLLRFLAERRVPNPVVITGDVHSNWVNDLRVDDRLPEQEIVASEFVCTSLSSGGNGVEKAEGDDELLAANPCVQFHNSERGYVRCTVTPETWQSDFMVVDDISQPGGRTFSRASFVIEAGQPGAKPV